MAFKEGTDEMVCNAYGQRHRARWYILPLRDRTTVKCQNCRTIMFDREANRDYYEVRAIND